ncbi:MAG: Omp28-related outer membrane protein [Bacteroidota bacterium]|nr:Omp28-related outer membrane protein [Bacteroidota bacterium]
MKKQLLFTLFGFALSLIAVSQTIVTTNPLHRNAVLEEFTGIHCGYCPEGHAIGADLLENNPGRMVVVAIHQGSFASPNAGEPDYRTDFGDGIANQTDLTGYPSGTVNRHEFDGMQQGNGTAMSRGSWSPATSIILGQDSPLNVGIMTSYEESTRELTVNVELYYTGDAVESTNFINVAILQSHVFGPQSGGGAGNNYEHMHMLRHFVTGQWGDEVTTTTTGTFIEKTYTYTLPDAIREVDLIAEDCEVAVYVTETTQEIITGDVVSLIDGTNQYIGSMQTSGENFMNGAAGEQTSFNFQAESNLEGDEDFTLTLSTDAPDDWAASFVIDGQSYDETATVTLSYDTPLDIALEVTPGATPGFKKYQFVMTSVSNPNAPEKYITFYVISGITDLLVNGTGGAATTQYQDVYLNALQNAGNTSHDVVRGDVFAEAYNANVLDEVKSVYFNVAWTFPAFSDAQATALMGYMDNGGNLFVAGQDIGWDIMSGSGNGNAITQNLYTNYLAADYVNDGSSSDNKLTANEDDVNYGEIDDATIVDMYSGNMYPDHLAPLGDATTAFYYNDNTSRGAAIVNETDVFSSVYFGVGLEMIAEEAVVDDIIAATNSLFNASGNGIFQIFEDKTVLGQNYPNPANDFTFIKVGVQSNSTLIVNDISGRVILEQNINSTDKMIKINTSNWKSGMYYYQLKNANNVKAKKLFKL